MNLFVLDRDPHTAACMQCDQHVVKMPIEVAQMLSMVLRSRGLGDTESSGVAEDGTVSLYKFAKAHFKHPATQWCLQNDANFFWALRYGLGTAAEYTTRYRRTHKAERVLQHVLELWSSFSSFRTLTPPLDYALCMPDAYKTDDPVESYRNYYIRDKARFARWNHTKAPYWWPHA